MFRLVFFFVLVALQLLASAPADAQFAAWHAPTLTTIRSPLNPNITVSFKSPDNNTCSTAFATQKQYTGWVNVPGAYNSNLFFWFVEARQQPADLTIWLNGGPGASSLLGFFTETGPCEIVEKGLNQWETAVREWGWDRASNMLFIDQPNQVGLSYDVPTNGSIDFVQGQQYVPAQAQKNKAQAPWTWSNGTFSSLGIRATDNTTQTSAYAVWHMLQGFMAAFPQYGPQNNGSLRVNLFAESYGGIYGPIFAQTWERQNALRLADAALRNASLEIQLSALGIINGCVDTAIQGPLYPAMAVNNTYGAQLSSQLQAQYVNASFWAPQTGCYDRIMNCRAAQAAYDPGNTGADSFVSTECQAAVNECANNVLDPFLAAGRSAYDIAHQSNDPFPPMHFLEYINTPAVQASIGAPINFTYVSQQVVQAFGQTGDQQRGGAVPALAALVSQGIRVGLMYGDRDFVCNWMGGEAVSLALAAQLGGAYAARFPAAGYAPIIVNDTYIGGVVRQFGNLSFSRIYQAGHSVPAYQPETAFQVFARIIMGTAVSDGKPVDLGGYNSSGSANATATAALPAAPSDTCYLRAVAGTCGQEAQAAIVNGSGVVINGVWYSASSAWPLAASSPTVTTATTTTTQTLTGWFTATVTPKGGAPMVASQPRRALLAAMLSLVASIIAL